MLSKPVAGLLLVIALAGAGIAGGFIATKTLKSPDSSEENADDLVPVPETPDPAATAAPTSGRPGAKSGRPSARPAAASSGRPSSYIDPKATSGSGATKAKDEGP